MIRQEILRLVRATRQSAFVNTRRLSAFYNVPERTVRRELLQLADENRIHLACPTCREEFIEKAPENVALRVDLVE
jgi:hypothetical protein